MFFLFSLLIFSLLDNFSSEDSGLIPYHDHPPSDAAALRESIDNVLADPLKFEKAIAERRQEMENFKEGNESVWNQIEKEISPISQKRNEESGHSKVNEKLKSPKQRSRSHSKSPRLNRTHDDITKVPFLCSLFLFIPFSLVVFSFLFVSFPFDCFIFFLFLFILFSFSLFFLFSF